MKILNSLPPYNLFGIDDQNYKAAKIVAVPVPYDSTTTYKSGTRDGPHALIEASRTVELYNEELGGDVSKLGIYTTDEIAPDFSSPENMVKRIENEISPIIADKKIPLLLGGEHTVSLGSVKALHSAGKKFTFLHFDAHSDSRNTYLGSKYCHACVVARVKETCKSYSVGIRSVDESTAKGKCNDILFMKDMHKMDSKAIINSILENTDKNIYLSVDLDVLDSSEMPSTGTPEPDGLRFNQLNELIKGVAKKRNVIGLDFVELAPIPGFTAPNYLAAKLVYLTLGHAFLKKD